MAAETVHGLSGKLTNDASLPAVARCRKQRTFFGDTKDNRNMQTLPSKVCGKQQGVWNCTEFTQKSVPDRWNIIKQNKLCYRCLA